MSSSSSSSSSSTTAVLVAGSALIVAGLSYCGMRMSSGKSSGTMNNNSHDNNGGPTITEIDDENCKESESGDNNTGQQHEQDYITPAEVAAVFDRLQLEMQAVFASITQQIQQLQMAGQMIPEKQLKSLLHAEMTRVLQIKQTQICDEFDMDYDCLEEATWEFLEEENKYPRVYKAVERFQKLWEQTTGEQVAGWRPGKDLADLIGSQEPVDVLGPERTIEVATVYFNSLTELMRSLVTQFQAEGKNMANPQIQQELNLKFGQRAQDAGEAALERRGVSQHQFEASVKAHAENPTVGRALGMLQMRQQQELQQLMAMSGGGGGMRM